MCGDTDFEVYDAHLRIFQKSTDPRGSFDRLGPRVRWFHVPNVDTEDVHASGIFSTCFQRLFLFMIDSNLPLADDHSGGDLQVKFGTLFNDERCANIFEALVGTLRAAKKRKVVAFDSEMLFQGIHDNVDVILKSP